jgi:hypothetical protein
LNILKAALFMELVNWDLNNGVTHASNGQRQLMRVRIRQVMKF